MDWKDNSHLGRVSSTWLSTIVKIYVMYGEPGIEQHLNLKVTSIQILHTISPLNHTYKVIRIKEMITN